MTYPSFFRNKMFEVELEGSRGIRYRLPKGKSSITLSAGRLQLLPRALHKTGAVTDLVRVEALREPLVGHSYDISGSEPSTLTLPSGVYHLARYTSYSGSEHQRSVHYTKVRVRPGAVTKLDFVYYQYEHKLKGTKNKTTRPVLSKKSNSPNILTIKPYLSQPKKFWASPHTLVLWLSRVLLYLPSCLPRLLSSECIG